MRRFNFSVLLAFCVSSCGGSGGNPLSSASISADSSIPETSVLIQSVFDRPLTDSASMPTGVSYYSGSASFSADTESQSEILLSPTMTSRFEMTANLQNGSISATLDQFRLSTGQLLAGNLQGNLSAFTDTNFLGTVSGSISQSNVATNFAGDISGQFRGSSGGFFAGDIQVTSNTGDLYGVYAAQKNTH